MIYSNVDEGTASTGVFSNITSETLVTEADFNAYLKEKKIVVDAELDKSIVSEEQQTDVIVESMRYSLLARGKRLRPILCIAVCEMFGGKIEHVLPTSIAIEMIHTASLIHDDLPCMDDDDTRRGIPTNHVKYGEDVAILAGDALLSHAVQHIAMHSKEVPKDKIMDVMLRLAMAVGTKGLVGGQVMDLYCESKNDVTIEDLVWIHNHKTGALLKATIASGAIIGGASEEEIKVCESYAEKIGLAFQIVDDILDVTSTTEVLGKSAGKDEKSNKATYVRFMGVENARKEAEKLIADAKELVSRFGDRSWPLVQLSDYILNRKK